MFFLRFVMVGAAALALCLYSEPAAACGADTPPEIRLTVEERPVRFNLSRSVRQLGARTPVATAMPAGFHAETAGVMQGQVELDHRIVFETLSTKDASCANIRAVDIILRIRPVIYVASDLQQKACLFREIFTHEAKHIEIDRSVLEKYASRFKDGMAMATAMPADYQTRWVPAAALDAEQQRLQGAVEGAMGVLFQTMMEDRNRQQQQVDTFEEYLNIGATCQSSS